MLSTHAVASYEPKALSKTAACKHEAHISCHLAGTEGESNKSDWQRRKASLER